MIDNKKVALFGWHPDVVNYDKWPGMTAEKLRAALEGDRDSLLELGYAVDLHYIRDGETAFDAATEALTGKPYECVLIGAGVRRDEDHFLVFEKLVNAVHKAAPQATICFNTNPSDTADAIKRWT
ncbi:hypothetical protein GCE9029_01542 [Grimontia celer]|uniref:6,7-dimethyl-8-ribityllumazine synthase n=1 Tax=Grimontia celer TaxID=1796497 RepID=A0A128EYB6_9GAMM|nr:hypothetical protein [Grimontia celer]CZF79579.1 hypothetical protein GCE9029_01542 [Grimontia celer]